MTTLDELLALLPDNNTGAIDAADLRTIVTALWGETATLASVVETLGEETSELGGRIAALESRSGGGGGPSISGVWQVNPTPGAVPQSMQVTSDNGTITTETTWVRFWKFDKSNTDLSAALLAAESLYGQQQANGANWAKATVTGAQDNGQWVELAVDVTGSGGTGSAGWQTAVVVLQT